MSSGQDSKTKLKVVKSDVKKSSHVPSAKSENDEKTEDRKKKITQIAKTKHQQDEPTDAMQSLLNMSQFEVPAKKKSIQKPPKSKEIQIDMENDSQEDIIKKLVLTVRSLKSELDEYKIYVDGTFCTSAVHNRNTDDLDKRVTELRTQVDDLTQ